MDSRRMLHLGLIALACTVTQWPTVAVAQGANSDSLGRESLRAPQAAIDSSKPRTCTAERPLKPVIAEDSLPHCVARVQVFADGNVKDVLGGNKASGVASGALGLHYIGSRYDVTGLINVIGSEDTVRSRFGSTVLLPAIGSGLNAAATVIRGRFRHWSDDRCADVNYGLLCNVGFRLHADASTRQWVTKSARVAPPEGQADTVEQVLATMAVPIWGAGIGLSYSFFAGDLRGSDDEARSVEMIFDAGLVRRAIRGDLTGGGAARDTLRRNLLGSDKTSYDGYQLGLTLVYNQVRSSFTYVRLGGDVDGLTGGQIVAIVDLRAALASGLLRRR